MPTLSEIVDRGAVIQHQTPLIDFTQLGTTDFQYAITDQIAALLVDEPNSDYRFKRSRVYLIVKKIVTGVNPVFPKISIAGVLPQKDLNNNNITVENQIIGFGELNFTVITNDLQLSVDVAATGFSNFTGYLVVEGSFINMAL